MKKPDAARRASLAAIIRHDLQAIGRLHPEVRIPALEASFAECAGVAFALHAIYCAFENSFDQISRTYENHVVDPARWHRELLGKMFLEIPGVRPAVLPERFAPIMNELRSFRHLFRHSYDYRLDPAKLAALGDIWRAEAEELIAAIENFMQWLIEEHPSYE